MKSVRDSLEMFIEQTVAQVKYPLAFGFLATGAALFASQMDLTGRRFFFWPQG